MRITNSFIQKTIKKSLPILGDEYKKGVYISSENPVRNSSTGEIKADENEIPIKAVIVSFRSGKEKTDISEISDEPIKEHDKKGIIEHHYLSSITPRIDDLITIGSMTYEIKGIKPLPYNSVYIFHLRPSKEV